MFIVTEYCQNDMQRESVHRKSKICVGREVFSVPKHDQSVLCYIIYYILYIK